MKHANKVILAVFIVLVLAIQFIPGNYNQSTKIPVNDITTVFKMHAKCAGNP